MSDDTECDPLAAAIEGVMTEGDPHRVAILACAFFAALTFVAFLITRKVSLGIWSMTPIVYTWLAVCDGRTLLMAILATVWGFRLKYDFYRRNGCLWPSLNGMEDYRWTVIRNGELFDILTNPFVWVVFHLLWVSIYQNFLLLLIAAPSFIARTAVYSPACRDSWVTFHVLGLDSVLAVVFLLFVVMETVADNQQYAFQTEKRRRRDAGEELTGDYAAGFCRSGLFSILRKPNYAAEQAIWITFYFFSVVALNGRLWNWSGFGFILYVLLFKSSGSFTESLSLNKYPKYAEYQKRVPLYIPFLLPALRSVLGKRVKSEKND